MLVFELILIMPELLVYVPSRSTAYPLLVFSAVIYIVSDVPVQLPPVLIESEPRYIFWLPKFSVPPLSIVVSPSKSAAPVIVTLPPFAMVRLPYSS